MAGVMGGQGTAVESSTQNIFLEAAFFSPEMIAGRARRFGFQTDASLRFERGVDPEHQVRAIERATKLLLDIAGGDPGPVVVTESKRHLSLKTPVSLRHERLQSLLGVSVEKKEVEKKLSFLQMNITQTEKGWSVVPPSFRFDISIEEDLIEEIGRMIGYDTIPAISEISSHRLGMSTETQVTEERITDLFVDRGYSEVVNYSFVDEELESAINPGIKPIRLVNPISQELGVMRRSLWPGLLTTAKQNLSRQQERLRLFETGAQFSQDASGVLEASVLAGLALGSQWPVHWGNDDREVDFFDIKADLEAVFELTGCSGKVRFSPVEHPALTPGKSARIFMGDDPIGWLGILHPKLEKQLELKKTVILFALQLKQSTLSRIPVHESYSKFPSVRRDIAVILDENISSEQVIQCSREAAGELLREIKLFDLYRGGSIESSRKSMALGLILQGASRTLNDLDADRVMDSVSKQLERKLGATIRK
jgi:phenylalanyl-tRNA synthetase beta chain